MKVLSQGEILNISDNAAWRFATILALSSPKVGHSLKGLQMSSAKCNIKKLDLNLLKTFSMADLQYFSDREFKMVKGTQ